jgi:hypothetical protein
MGRERNTSGELTSRGFEQSSGIWRPAEINDDSRLLLLVDAVVDLWRRASGAGKS